MVLQSLNHAATGDPNFFSNLPITQSANLLHSRQERSRIVEPARLSFGPGVELRGVNQDLTVWRQLDVGAVHRTGSRAFEVHSFAVVAAAVAGALEFVFAGLPVRRAAQVGAACVDHKEAVRSAIDPDAVFLLKHTTTTESKLR